MGYKVGQELILSTPDEKFTQVRLWNNLPRSKHRRSHLHVLSDTARMVTCNPVITAILAPLELHVMATARVQQ